MNPLRSALLVALAAFASACGAPDPAPTEENTGLAPVSLSQALTGHSLDIPETIDVGSWNVEWLGATGYGPRDEGLQLRNVATVIAGINLDIVGLVEVVSEAAFSELVRSVPGTHGILATDANVVGGAEAYSDDEQKVALVMKDRFHVTGARIVLAEESWSFAGRPPMEVSVSFSERGRRRTLDVVVVHFKAMANADGYARRTRAAAALKAWLLAEHPRDWVVVVGDFNDDLDRSTYRAKVSPLSTLLMDPEFRFTTQALTEESVPTTVHFSATIDHHLVTAALSSRFIDGSAAVIHPEAWIRSYGDTTSDHYPVVTRYNLR